MKKRGYFSLCWMFILCFSCAVKPTFENGRLLYGEKNYNKTLMVLSAYVQTEPEDKGKVAEALYMIAESNIKLDKKSDAEKVYFKIIETYPGTEHSRKAVLKGVDKVYGQSMIAEGKYRLVQRKFDSGIKLLRLFVTGAPDFELAPSALFFVGEGYDMKGDPQMARKTYQEVVDKYPKNPYAALCLRFLGHYLRDEGKYTEAESKFITSQEHNSMNSNLEDCWLDLAELYHYKMKDLDKALVEYAKLFIKTQNPRLAPKSYYASALIYMERGQNDKAKPLLEKIIKNYEWSKKVKPAKEALEKIKNKS